MFMKFMGTFGIFIPNGYLRLQPFIEDGVSFFRAYGLVATFEHVLPIYFQSFPVLYGWRLAWTFLWLALTFLYAMIAAKALVILLTKFVLWLGFRAEESGDSVLLHPDEEV